MKHRNITTEKWTRMAIDSLFERGARVDWEEFSLALQKDETLAGETLFMCEHHQNRESAMLAKTLAEYFFSTISAGKGKVKEERKYNEQNK